MAGFFSILSLLLFVSLSCYVTTLPQTLTSEDLNNALRVVGKQLCPQLTKFDYATTFGPDLTPEQIQATEYFVSPRFSTNNTIEASMEQPDVTRFWSSMSGRSTIDDTTLDRLKNIAIFASMSYCDNSETLKDFACGDKCLNPRVVGTKVVKVLEKSSTFGFISVRESSQQIIVSFRGTSNIYNWLEDLEFIQKDWPYPLAMVYDDYRVHMGFIENYEYVRQDVLKTVKELATAYKDYSVVLTGHSLGAAIATIAALDLHGTQTIERQRIELITFASPRVGNDKLSQAISAAGFGYTDRYVHKNDIVPHVPPRLSGFVHIEGERFYHRGKVYSCHGSEDRKCGHRWVPLLTADAHSHFLDDPKFFSSDDCFSKS